MKTNMLIITLWYVEMEESNAGNLYPPANADLFLWKQSACLVKGPLKIIYGKIKIRDIKFVLLFLAVACENVDALK